MQNTPIENTADQNHPVQIGGYSRIICRNTAELPKPMKKQKFQSISIRYDHGYYIFFQPTEKSFYFSFGATFQQMERAKEYIEFQAGKTVAKKFDPWFDIVKDAILNNPNFTVQEGFLLNLKK